MRLISLFAALAVSLILFTVVPRETREASAEWFWPCSAGQRALNVTLPANSAISVETQLAGQGAFYSIGSRRDQQWFEDWNFNASFLRTCLPYGGTQIVGIYRITCPSSVQFIVDLRTQEQSIAC